MIVKLNKILIMYVKAPPQEMKKKSMCIRGYLNGIKSDRAFTCEVTVGVAPTNNSFADCPLDYLSTLPIKRGVLPPLLPYAMTGQVCFNSF